VRHVLEHLRLGQADRRHRGTGLPVQIGKIEAVEVGNPVLAHTQAGQRQQVRATDTAQAGDRHPLAAQDLLLGAGHPEPMLRENASSYGKPGARCAGRSARRLGRHSLCREASRRLRCGRDREFVRHLYTSDECRPIRGGTGLRDR
jgi:hypothetical protein